MARTIVRGRLFWAASLALGIIVLGLGGGDARAQNIPDPDPIKKQTFSGEIVYKGAAGTNYGVIGGYNKDEKYAKEFKLKQEEYEKLKVDEGDNVEVSWEGPGNDRTTRNNIKVKKMSAASRD
jgi:hypothetical protein